MTQRHKSKKELLSRSFNQSEKLFWTQKKKFEGPSITFYIFSKIENCLNLKIIVRNTPYVTW